MHPLARKHAQLHALADSFEQLRAFDLELRRRTKGKPFRVTNDLAWKSIHGLVRALIIDLAAWVRDLHEGWLRVNLAEGVLASLRVSKGDAAKRAARAWVHAPPEDQRLLRGALARDIFEGRRAALARLFGKSVAKRGHAEGPDVAEFEERLATWADKLHQARHTQAHPLGDPRRAVYLPLRTLSLKLAKCWRVMNDLRLLVLDESMSKPVPAGRSRTHPHAEDLDDLVLLGTIEFSRAQIDTMPGRWAGEKREAYYARLHARRRPAKVLPFNEPL